MENQKRKVGEAKQNLIDRKRKLELRERNMDRAQREIPKGMHSPSASCCPLQLASTDIFVDEAGGKAVGIRAGDGIMNSLSTAAKGVKEAVLAVNNLITSGGPTLNVKMTSEKKVAAHPSDSSNAQSTPSDQKVAAAVAAREVDKKMKKDTRRRAHEAFESSKKEYLECEKSFFELEKQDKEAKDQFNEIQLQLQRLGQKQLSIVCFLTPLTAYAVPAFILIFSILLIGSLSFRTRQLQMLMCGETIRRIPRESFLAASTTSPGFNIIS